jgi:transcriptional antiterminator NusG
MSWDISQTVMEPNSIDQYPDESTAWYAVRTRSNFESKVLQQLQGRSITSFLPKVWVWSRRRDRRKKISVPLFPGYLFVRLELNAQTHLNVVQTAGAVNLVGVKGKPVPVADDEMANLQVLDGTDRSLRQLSGMKKGDKLMIIDGPLKGLIGTYQRLKDKSARLVVGLSLLNQSVAVELDDWAVEPLS